MSDMICASPETESARLAALRALEILDTAPEPEFDELVRLASAICETPIGVISLIDSERQWFKAQIGLGIYETPRTVAFCDHAIRQPEIFVVEDAQDDARFAANPLVTGGPQIRFYAGIPVTGSDGHALGTLCVIDSKPRTLSNGQKTALRILAAQVNARLELREQRRKLEEALRVAEEAVQVAEDSQRKARESEERFRTFMDHAPFIGFMKNEAGEFLYYNRPFANAFNLQGDEWLGKTVFDLFPAQDASGYDRDDREVLDSGQPRIIEESSENSAGRIHHWRSHKFRYIDETGQKLLGGVSVEITAELERETNLRRSQQELEHANHQLATMVRTDALTGLHNRRGFDERLHAEFGRARRADRRLSVLILDVDNFKHRNDTYGHAEGDATLKQLGGVLQSAVRAGDLVARYGGEEFVILLPEAGEAEASRLADRLLAAVRSHAWHKEAVTVSIGAASLHPAMRDEARLLALADEAMYAAKQSGKDKAVNYGAYLRKVSSGLPDLSQHPLSNSLPV